MIDCARKLAALLGTLAIVACGSGDSREGTSASAIAGGQPPQIQYLRLQPAHPVAGDEVTAEIKIRDADGDDVAVAYEWTVGGVPASETGPRLKLGSVPKGTVVEVVAVASDASASSDPVRQSVKVRNRRPRLDEVRIEPWDKISRGETLSARAHAVDPDGDPLRYEYIWRVNGNPVDAEGTSFSTAGLKGGDSVQVRAIAHDRDGASDPIDSARVRVVGSNPKIVSTPGGFSSDGVFRYTVEVEHPEGDQALRFQLRVAPDGMTVDPASGEISWAPRRNQVGEYEVAVAVEDSQGAVTVQGFQVTVQPWGSAPANLAPR